MMKIICEKENLLKCINIVQKAIPNKTSFPILECILIDARNNEIKLITNNIELGIKTIVDGDIIVHGLVAIKAKTFNDVIKNMPCGKITIEVSKNNDAIVSHITSFNLKFDINSQNGDNFIFLPLIEKKSSILISKFKLKDMIRKTIFSISYNNNNKLMTGELFEINENKLKMATLDGNRISQKITELENLEKNIRIIIPGNTLIEINKILSNEIDEKIKIYVNKKHILFNFDKTIIVSRLIEGNYFNIDNMMNDEYETKVIINKQNMLNCIERSTLLIREGDRKPIVINITDNIMKLQMKSSLGEMNENININKEGKNILIGFNPFFFIDALRSIDDEEVSIYFTSPNSPCYIRDIEKTYNYLILPLRFSHI